MNNNIMVLSENYSDLAVWHDMITSGQEITSCTLAHTQEEAFHELSKGSKYSSIVVTSEQTNNGVTCADFLASLLKIGHAPRNMVLVTSEEDLSMIKTILQSRAFVKILKRSDLKNEIMR